MVVSVPNREQQEAVILAVVSEKPSYLSSCCLCIRRLFVSGVLYKMSVLKGLLCEGSL